MKYAIYPYTLDNHYFNILECEKEFEIVTYILSGGIYSEFKDEQQKNVCTMKDIMNDTKVNFDEVLILDSNMVNYEEYERAVEIFMKKEVRIVLATNTYDKALMEKYVPKYGNIIDICNWKKKSGSIELEKSACTMKYDINTPIITVMGVGYNTSKFDIQLYLRKHFIGKGYKVAQIGSKKVSEFFDFYSMPAFMFDHSYSSEEKIFRFSEYVKKIEEIERPDVIIIGIPEPILPLNKKHPFSFGIYAFEILNAIEADYSILSLMHGEYGQDFMTEMKNLCRYRYNIEIDDFFVSNFTIVSNSLYSSELKYVFAEDECKKNKDIVLWGMSDLKQEVFFEKVEKKLKKYAEFEQF